MDNSVNQRLLMQYQTPLPDDFDVALLRTRIDEVGPAFDRLHGLIFKLYGLNDSPPAVLREYSSVYLWEGPAPMHALLSGDLFDNYPQAFARPVVRWFLVHAVRGEPAVLAHAKQAVRRLIPIPRKSHVGSVLAAWHKRLARTNALMQVTGFDPAAWEMVDLTVWGDGSDAPRPGDLDHVYSIARVSLPPRAAHCGAG